MFKSFKLLNRLVLVSLFLGCASFNSGYAYDNSLFTLNEPLEVKLVDGQLGMADAIRMALINNPVIAIENAALEEKNQAISENISYLYPKLFFSQTFNSSNNPVQAFMMSLSQRNLNFPNVNFNYPGAQNNFSTRVGGTLSLFDRSLYRKIDLSKIEFKLQQEIGKKSVDDLIFNVRKAYLNVQVAKERNDNVKRSLDLAKEQLDTVQAKKDAGTASKSDYLSQKVRVSSFEEEFVKAKNDLNLAWIVLADLVGDETIVGYQLTEEMKDKYSIDDIDKLVKYAYLHRPEIRAVEIEKDKALMELKLSKTSGAMTVNVQGEWGIDTIFDDAAIAQSYTAGVFIRKDLFDGGLRRAKIKRSEAGINRYNALIDKEYRAAKLDVVQNYLAFKNAEERLNKIKTVVEDSDESLRTFKERYKVGLSTNLEVQQAQTRYYDSRYLRINALYDLKMAVVGLQRAIGMPVADILQNKSLLITPVNDDTDYKDNTMDYDNIRLDSDPRRIFNIDTRDNEDSSSGSDQSK